jgi:superfamily II DNA or RNA helicase
MNKRFLKSKGKTSSLTTTSSTYSSSSSSSSLTQDYKTLIQQHAYLGKKGYTIPKAIMSKEDLDYLYKDLMVKPEVFGPMTKGASIEINVWPVFRENDKKIYLPRFYGVARYGEPCQAKEDLDPGLDISLTFEKPLRDYQDAIIKVYMDHVQKEKGQIEKGQTSMSFTGGGILQVPCGRGKCLGKNTPVLMYNGIVKYVQNIKVGDLIMGDDSTPRRVLTLAHGLEQMYRVATHLNIEDDYWVNESHILSLKTKEGRVVDISVVDYLALPASEKKELFGYRVAVEFEEKPLTCGDPYRLGFTAANIPHVYKCNTKSIRMAVLAGIIDSCGTLVGNQVYEFEIYNDEAHLAYDLMFIARTVGLTVHHRCPNNRHLIHIYGPKTILCAIPVKKPEKQVTNQCGGGNEDDDQRLIYPIRVEPGIIDEYYGFEIDGNHRFVLGDCSVTHNTVMALKIISLIQKKTLIIVHKEFLMNQWIERIAEFLPGATVGKIQGSLFDVEGKDIVIGMVQTLYDKEYSGSPFASFGLTIVDEVHRIGSEQFSRTLFKTITPCMLGISATVERKDQLTKLLYMFIGPLIYSEERTDEDPVCVRAIHYKTSDPEFNEVEVDFRGNTKYSTMITKLCAFGPRSDFIIRVIADLIEEDAEKQIMILAHNRCLLTYLYEAIIHKGIAAGSVGYYVGGMKQKDLQETETKSIVLATYAMAAEALDIKTLSTLIMVTPKTDITQSVGRILRAKHDNPIIVDIVDAHDVFKNQWTQRRRFYKSCNYRILEIDSNQYQLGSIRTWKKTFEPKDIKKGSKCTNQNNKRTFMDEDSVKPCLIDTSLFDDLI